MAAEPCACPESPSGRSRCRGLALASHAGEAADHLTSRHQPPRGVQVPPVVGVRADEALIRGAILPERLAPAVGVQGLDRREIEDAGARTSPAHQVVEAIALHVGELHPVGPSKPFAREDAEATGSVPEGRRDVHERGPGVPTRQVVHG